IAQEQVAETRTTEAQGRQKEAEVKAFEQEKIARLRQRTAFSRELASSARSQLQGDPELSALLAIEAVKQDKTLEAEDILRQSVNETFGRVIKHTGPNSSCPPVFSADGNLVVTAGADNTV